MVYAKAFFDLQLQFARKVTALSGLPLTSVLLKHSNFYIRFGLGRDFDPLHPTWLGRVVKISGIRYNLSEESSEEKSR